jgi:predicted Zn-dependent protease
MSRTRNRMRRWGTVTLCAAAIAGCARNPVTGKTELSLIGEGQEIEMGRQGAQEVVQTIGLVNDEALQSYVHQIGAKMAAASERPNLPWQFRVVDDASPNAFALPGGFIFVTRGLLSLMDNEAELASVLGHEIGHVTARHSVSQMSKAQLAQVGLGLAMILKPELQQFGNLAGQGLQLLFLKYGRDDENQADDLGFRYALTDGYDIREMADVFATLDRVGSKSNQGKLPEWLSTHPDPGNRIKKTEQRIARLDRPLTGLRQGETEFMQRIQGLVYGENPRNGFFQGSTFLHPDLRFQMTFPSGWRAQNTPQAVIAVSPQQDAMIQLTLAQQASPAAAAQQFFSQQGLQLLRQPVSQNVNGNPVVVGYFQAQTQQGVIGGVASFLSFGGRTYQLLAYTPGQLLGQYERTFLQTVGSFSELRDPAALAVQPNKVNVVRLTENMTLAEFNQRYPSAVPIEDLAIINQVDGPSSQLAAGTLAKQVQGNFVAGR